MILNQFIANFIGFLTSILIMIQALLVSHNAHSCFVYICSDVLYNHAKYDVNNKLNTNTCKPCLILVYLIIWLFSFCVPYRFKKGVRDDTGCYPLNSSVTIWTTSLVWETAIDIEKAIPDKSSPHHGGVEKQNGRLCT